ncbi:MAG: hypothetical protein RJB39_196 [Candidatus Parcubacteria bacterium]|jgi:hypothetical protein
MTLTSLYYAITHNPIYLCLAFFLLALPVFLTIFYFTHKRNGKPFLWLSCLFSGLASLILPSLSSAFIEYPMGNGSIWAYREGKWTGYDRPILHMPCAWDGWSEGDRYELSCKSDPFILEKTPASTVPVLAQLEVELRNDPKQPAVFFSKLGPSTNIFNGSRERKLLIDALNRRITRLVFTMNRDQLQEAKGRDTALQAALQGMGVLITSTRLTTD